MQLKFLIIGASALIIGSCGGSSSNSNSGSLVPAINSAPTVTSANMDQSGQVGFSFSYDATQSGQTFSDIDGDTLTFSATVTPNNAGLSITDGVISGTPQQTGVYAVTITASDGTLQVSDQFNINITADQNATQAKFGADSINLDNLANYANPTVPAYIRNANTVTNPVTDKGATLGRIIFYDRTLSVDGTVSCSSCHQQSNGFSDTGVTSQGVFGSATGRSSMRLVNTLYGQETRFFWDERAVDMEDQVTQPLRDHGEHGFSGQNGRPDFDDLIAIMAADESYLELFRFVFLDESITEGRIQSALAQFVHSITSFDSRFDVGRAQVANDADQFPNFTADENAGKTLFLRPPGGNNGGAGCAVCHDAPDFTIAQNRNQNGVVGVAADPAAFDFTNTRAPSLRDVVRANGTPNGPFMHDGSLATLRDVMDHYDNIPVPPNEPEQTQFLNTLDNRLIDTGTPRVLNLSDTEKEQVVAFMETLTGTNIYTDEKWSNPFP